jgi:cystathionine gamma-synthase
MANPRHLQEDGKPDVTEQGAANGIRAFGAVAPPIYLSSTFTFQGFEWARTCDYTRAGNPTRDVLADLATGLEG